MRPLAPGNTNGNRVHPWLALALLLAATAAGATEPAGGAIEPITPVTEPVASATALVAHAEAVAQDTEPVAQAAAPVARAMESSRGAGRQRTSNTTPHIGRIFSSPAER